MRKTGRPPDVAKVLSDLNDKERLVLLVFRVSSGQTMMHLEDSLPSAMCPPEQIAYVVDSLVKRNIVLRFEGFFPTNGATYYRLSELGESVATEFEREERGRSYPLTCQYLANYIAEKWPRVKTSKESKAILDLAMSNPKEFIQRLSTPAAR